MSDISFSEAIQIQKEFNEARGWEKDTKFIKDFLLNLCEEVGEAWHVIKWVGYEKQAKLLKEHKLEFENFVGDSLFLIYKIAWLLDIDPAKAYKDVMEEYETRFPADVVKKLKHGNPLAGGVDDKHNTKGDK